MYRRRGNFVVERKKNVMRNFKLFFGLCSLLLLLTACPTEQNYPLEEKNVHEIDASLLGTWTCAKEDNLAQKLTISKKSNYLYTIVVDEPGSGYYLDTRRLTGWIAKLDGQIFLVTEEEANPSVYYITSIESVSAKSMTILHYEGDSEGVKSKDDLRRKVQRELRLGGAFEYDFSVVYNKE
jgi:hypothetical protein